MIKGTPDNNNRAGSHLKCWLINARSVVNKQPEVAVFIQIQNSDLLLITESWLHQDILDSEVNILGYQMIRRDNHELNGCLLVCISIFLVTYSRYVKRLVTHDLFGKNPCCVSFRGSNMQGNIF